MTQLVVLAGPTAVGKGTVVKALTQAHADVWLSISATTREPRPGEEDGREYFFVTPEEFSHMIETDALLEYATVHGRHQYGTPRAPIEERLAQGIPCLLEIDLQGARQVKANRPDTLSVFLMPPSWEELERRLIGRGTENSEEMMRRLATAQVELDAAGEFDHIVVNDDLDTAVSEVNALLRS